MAVYVCAHCKKNYDVYASYYSHVTTKHKEPKIKCPNCDEKFNTYIQLYTHNYKVHNASTETKPASSTHIAIPPPDKTRSALSNMLVFN